MLQMGETQHNGVSKHDYTLETPKNSSREVQEALKSDLAIHTEFPTERFSKNRHEWLTPALIWVMQRSALFQNDATEETLFDVKDVPLNFLKYQVDLS